MSGAAVSVAIITPSLNQGRFIERTITSVLEQDYPHIEYVIVDGGSTDETLDVIRKYEHRISSWVSEPDDGQVDAIMKGIAMTDADAFAYINSDDYYLPGAVAALAGALAQEPAADWSVGACRYVTPDGATVRLWEPALPQGPRRRIVDETWYVPQASSLWRRRVLDDLGPLRGDLHYVFDTEFTVRLALAGRLPVIVDQEVAIRYLHEDAKSARPELFADEWRRVQREFRSDFGVTDVAEDLVFRSRRFLRRHGRAGTAR